MKVECYAGYRGEETPKCFYLDKRCVEVMDVLDRWLDPAHRYFKLRGDDNAIYILRHSTSEDTWEMILFNRKEERGKKGSVTNDNHSRMSPTP